LIRFRVLLKIIAYYIVGQLFGYSRGDDPVLGVFLYGFVHIVLALATWGSACPAYIDWYSSYSFLRNCGVNLNE
jgi:hypothetical protein